MERSEDRPYNTESLRSFLHFALAIDCAVKGSGRLHDAGVASFHDPRCESLSHLSGDFPMQQSFRLLLAAVGLGVGLIAGSPAPAEDEKAEGWIPLFNGKDFTGWKIPNPPSGTFKGVKETKNDAGKIIAF